MSKITMISSDKNWLEDAAGLPDLYPGKTPVGAVFITEDIIYPHLIGNDIGCGVSLFMTEIEKKKIKLDRWEKKLGELGGLLDIEITDVNKDDVSDLTGYILNELFCICRHSDRNFTLVNFNKELFFMSKKLRAGIIGGSINNGWARGTHISAMAQ